VLAEEAESELLFRHQTLGVSQDQSGFIAGLAV